MDQKQKILEFRERLDITLASPHLADNESVKSLVRKQLLSSSFCGTEGDVEGVVQRRTTEILKFLDLSRSVAQNDREASRTHGTSHGDWKLKQDNDDLRVMYREGPQGSPFHTLLVEGFVDGPIDVCLCVSWESTFYRKWWPQFNIPTFKIVQSTCLKQVGIGEEISLVRVKVPWPVSAREAIVHYFELECFEDDLVIVQMNTVSDTEHIDFHTHGFTRDGIPEARDIVRIDMAGGMALQRMGPNKSYFRTIANFDMKLDFLPATFINFVSRQLIGSGFKLFQKAVASVVANGDDDYKRTLEERPMYKRIQESLNSHNEVKNPNILEQDRSSISLTELHALETVNTDNPTATDEIDSDEAEQIIHLEVNQQVHHSMHQTAEQQDVREEAHFLSPEVEQALCMLDKAIAVVGGCETSSNSTMQTTSTQQKLLKSRRHGNFGMTCNEVRVVDATGDASEDSTVQNLRVADSYNSSGEESHQNEIGSRQLYPNSSTMNKIQAKASSSSDDAATHSDMLAAHLPQRINGLQKTAEIGAEEAHEMSVDGGKEKCKQGKKKKKQRICCM